MCAHVCVCVCVCVSACLCLCEIVCILEIETGEGKKLQLQDLVCVCVCVCVCVNQRNKISFLCLPLFHESNTRNGFIYSFDVANFDSFVGSRINYNFNFSQYQLLYFFGLIVFF